MWGKLNMVSQSEKGVRPNTPNLPSDGPVIVFDLAYRQAFFAF